MSQRAGAMVSSATGASVSRTRLHVLRAMYLLIALGLGAHIWPDLLQHSGAWAKRHGDTAALLAGVSVLSLWGLWQPLRMLPILLFELVWKLLWMGLVALPLWWQGQLDDGVRASIFACAMGLLLLPIAIPWRYAWLRYVLGR